jgi:hypothetical protein
MTHLPAWLRNHPGQAAYFLLTGAVVLFGLIRGSLESSARGLELLILTPITILGVFAAYSIVVSICKLRGWRLARSTRVGATRTGIRVAELSTALADGLPIDRVQLLPPYFGFCPADGGLEFWTSSTATAPLAVIARSDIEFAYVGRVSSSRTFAAIWVKVRLDEALVPLVLFGDGLFDVTPMGARRMERFLSELHLPLRDAGLDEPSRETIK